MRIYVWIILIYTKNILIIQKNYIIINIIKNIILKNIIYQQ